MFLESPLYLDSVQWLGYNKSKLLFSLLTKTSRRQYKVKAAKLKHLQP